MKEIDYEGFFQYTVFFQKPGIGASPIVCLFDYRGFYRFMGVHRDHFDIVGARLFYGSQAEPAYLRHFSCHVHDWNDTLIYSLL